MTIDRAIVLVGMMGVGKTAIGRRLAAQLGLPFTDVDDEIAQAAGMSVGDLFTLHGEESFRDGEARVMERLLDSGPKVLATGGGAFIRPSTRARILQSGAVSVWLKADIQTIAKRATRRPTRPLLRNGDAKEILTRLLNERKEAYGEADIHVESVSGPHSATVDAVEKAIMAFLENPRTQQHATEDDTDCKQDRP